MTSCYYMRMKILGITLKLDQFEKYNSLLSVVQFNRDLFKLFVKCRYTNLDWLFKGGNELWLISFN